MIDPELIRHFESAKGMTSRAIGRDIKKIEALMEIDCESALIKIHRVSERILGHFFGMNPGDKCVSVWDAMSSYGAKKIPPKVRIHFNNIKNMVDEFLSVNAGIFVKRKEPQLSEVEFFSESLNSIIKWYLEEVYPSADNDYNLVIYEGESISEEMIRQASAIDYEVFPCDYIANTDLCISWFHKNPEIYIIAVDDDTDKVIGYLNAMPLEDDYFLKYEEGIVADVEIPDSAVRKYNLPGFYKLLLCSVAISTGYQGTLVFKGIFDAFIDKLISLTEKEIYITEVLADAVTNDGKRLSEYFGLKPLLNGKMGELYKTTLLPPLIRTLTPRSKVLKEIYLHKNTEFKIAINEACQKNNLSGMQLDAAIKVLFIGVNPKNTMQLRIDEEVREIENSIRMSKFRDNFSLIQKWAVRSSDLIDAIMNVQPDFIHFSGHGYYDFGDSKEGGLAFEDQSGRLNIVSGQSLAFLLKSIQSDSKAIRCLIMNACYSSEQVKYLSEYIPYVIGIDSEISDRASILFSTGFYTAIGAGESIESSFNIACSLIKLEGSDDYLLPILLKSKET